MRDVFGGSSGFSEIDGTLTAENSSVLWPNDQVTFFDSHDESRFLTFNNNKNRLHEAIALLLTCRGIPVIPHGDEQYLHNDTQGGGDPFNRVAMTSFDTTQTAYRLIQSLSKLRQDNDAVGYGAFQQRWINKNDSTSYPISGLFTALPTGAYTDYLSGLLSGIGLTVQAGNGVNNPVANFTLPAHTVALWQFAGKAGAPEVSSIGPTVGQRVTIAGKGFGAAMGQVLLDRPWRPPFNRGPTHRSL